MFKTTKIGLIVGLAIILRWCTTYHPHSGQHKPPMYGDYEAQRHWQEITINLPIEQWYTNSSNNDLQYWGLDYPPLTAYHSLLLGQFAKSIDPKSIVLFKSRGYETTEHKHFMRLSVLIVDLFIFITAIIIYFYSPAIINDQKNIRGNNIFGFNRLDIILITALLYPGIILIDHGHFQYNCVSLGLFVFSVASILRGRLLIASFLFVLGLNYKQMELYHALTFFFYILGCCTPRKSRNKSILTCLKLFISISLTVVVTFVLVWAPFIQKWQTFHDLIVRLFPVARGVFEDKVANIWCTINIFVKLRELFSNEQLAIICLIVTLIGIIPSCLDIFLRPIKEKFIISLINTSLAFYLFSFQVHEKSILLVAIPVVLYFHKDPLVCFWFLILSTFSMLPLLIKDGLFVAYCALMILYFVSVYSMWLEEFFIHAKIDNNDGKKSKGFKKSRNRAVTSIKKESQFYSTMSLELNTRENILNRLSAYASFNLDNQLKQILFSCSMTGVVILSLANNFINPPKRYPDLFPLLISIYCCIHFCLFFIYFNYQQISGNNRKSIKPKLY